MQNRTDLFNTYALKNRYYGNITIGGWDTWVSMGTFIDFAGGRNNLHEHSYFEACLVLEGKGTFLYDNREYPVNSGDLFIADPFKVHEIISDITDHLKIHFISFNFKDTVIIGSDELYSTYIGNFITAHRMITPDCGDMAPLFAFMHNVSEIKPISRWELLTRSCIENILATVISASALHHIEIPTESIDSRLQMAIYFIHDNCRRRLTINEIADYASTSERTLRRLFEKRYQMSITGYCLERRIQSSADYLLTHPESTIADIGYLFDFSNPSDYSRSFKKLLGISPRGFRESRGTIRGSH